MKILFLYALVLVVYIFLIFILYKINSSFETEEEYEFIFPVLKNKSIVLKAKNIDCRVFFFSETYLYIRDTFFLNKCKKNSTQNNTEFFRCDTNLAKNSDKENCRNKNNLENSYVKNIDVEDTQLKESLNILNCFDIKIIINKQVFSLNKFFIINKQLFFFFTTNFKYGLLKVKIENDFNFIFNLYTNIQEKVLVSIKYFIFPQICIIKQVKNGMVFKNSDEIFSISSFCKNIKSGFRYQKFMSLNSNIWFSSQNKKCRRKQNFSDYRIGFPNNYFFSLKTTKKVLENSLFTMLNISRKEEPNCDYQLINKLKTYIDFIENNQLFFNKKSFAEKLYNNLKKRILNNKDSSGLYFVEKNLPFVSNTYMLNTLIKNNISVDSILIFFIEKILGISLEDGYIKFHKQSDFSVCEFSFKNNNCNYKIFRKENNINVLCNGITYTNVNLFKY